MTRLDAAAIAALLATLAGWHQRGDAIEKRFDCGDFDGSLAFVNAVAAVANRLDHHPDIALAWNVVTITTHSHDAGGLTSRDFRLATAIDAIAPVARPG